MHNHKFGLTIFIQHNQGLFNKLMIAQLRYKNMHRFLIKLEKENLEIYLQIFLI